MSLLQQYLEKIEELRATDRDPELFGLDEPEPEEPIDENEGVYKKMIMRAYRLNRPLRYIDIVELLRTGKVGVWTSKQRTNNRGYGAMNLQGYGRGGEGILKGWFNKDATGKYVPIPSLMERVLSGAFKPFGGFSDPNAHWDRERAKRFKREKDQRQMNRFMSRWS
jgi:hypothetical protein